MSTQNDQDIRDVPGEAEDEDFTMPEGFTTKGTAVRLMGELVGAQRWRLVVVIVAILLYQVTNLLAPMAMSSAINQASDAALGTAALDMGKFAQTIALLAVLYLLSSLFSFVQQRTMASVAQTLTLTLREKISEKMGRLPLSYFDHTKKGELLSRATSDLERVADTLQDTLIQLIESVVGVVGSVIMMVMISGELTIIAVVAVVLSLVVTNLVAARTESAFARSQEALGKLNSTIEEAFTGNTVVKTFNLEDDFEEEAGKLSQDLCEANAEAMFSSFSISPVIRLINQFGYVAIAVRGAMMAIAGTLTIGEIEAFVQYVNQVSEPVTQISYTVNSLQGAIAAAARVFEILDAEEEVPDCAEPAVLENPVGNVSFRHVRFGYSPDVPLMEDVSFDVPAGSKVAVVGPTGAGKTTLVNLLMRFYDVDGGDITVDDTSIYQMRREDLRSLTGMVLQDTWLFGGTIAENIAYGKANATKEQIYEAAVAAHAEHFIRTMPQGFDTVLSDELASLSQGQRQLLTIARAILADPAILILDEATSSVDTRTEQEIQKAMDTLMEHRTSFVIAHRLSTIRDADSILVMNHGTIVEQGTHDELLAAGGAYADLYESQFASSAE